MVNKSGQVAALGSVDDVVHVDPEQVGRPDALLLVALLPHVGDDGAYHHAHVLNHHLVGPYGLAGEQAPVVNGGLAEGHVFPAELEI